ncbi:GLUG motif-containing protein, partial [Microbulbifer mangrovi]|uniref:GLUG motif-containing protein n=1 Tax=Microbulbifer mangrovi TaxID=927787 RepID=UPI0023AACE46
MPRAIFLFLSLCVSLLLSVQQAWSAEGRADYDLDDDGLIEINDWADLDEIRNNLEGTSLYGSSEGCPAEGCVGFELTTDLDFDTNGDGSLDSNDAYWNAGEGWLPIGNLSSNSFSAVIHGNGYVVRNLMIERPGVGSQGLFGALDNATVKELGLNGPLMSVRGGHNVGGLAGYASSSQFTATFVSGSVMGTGDYVGGLIGSASDSEITASYVTGTVTGEDYVGGLIGGRGNVIASVSTAYVVSSRFSSGLIGRWGSADISYWAEDISSKKDSNYGVAVNLIELQCPTDADNTSCTDTKLYEGWSNYKDSDGNAYWDFGGDTELPGLRLGGRVHRDADGDGVADADDPFPTEFAGGFDSDGDGAIDFWTLGCDADCRRESGVNLDQFPDSAAAIVDADWDGLPDQWHEGCDSSCQSASGLTLDDSLNDTDNDGITNLIDDDDNNDGIIDADANSNGLIEVATWAELDAIRYSLDGTGKRLTAEGELDLSGCPHIIETGVSQKRCQGYELVADLDFDTNG